MMRATETMEGNLGFVPPLKMTEDAGAAPDGEGEGEAVGICYSAWEEINVCCGFFCCFG